MRAVVAVAALLLGGCAGGDLPAIPVEPAAPAAGPGAVLETATPGQLTVEVSMVDRAYDPVRVRVAAGSVLRFANRGGQPHTATFAGGALDTGAIPAGRRVDVVLTEPGTFDFTCRFHPDMEGQVTVTP
ncbi:MAG: cupredoxin domain-containing protein [Actinomycetes bacterium]